MHFWLEVLPALGAHIPIVIAQADNSIGFKVFSSSDVDPNILIYSLTALMLSIFIVIFATYRYKQWKKFKEFEAEMKSLSLEPEHEGTLANMVRRSSMDEPVNILFSPRLFDEMASVEIIRVLGSAGSVESKQAFIDKVYSIRTKTYHPEWLAAERPSKKAGEDSGENPEEKPQSSYYSKIARS